MRLIEPFVCQKTKHPWQSCQPFFQGKNDIHNPPKKNTLAFETYEEETRVHDALTIDLAAATGRWAPSELPPGQTLRPPEALYAKLEPENVDEERARLGK